MRALLHFAGLMIQCGVGASICAVLIEPSLSPSACGAVVGAACATLYFSGMAIGRYERSTPPSSDATKEPK